MNFDGLDLTNDEWMKKLRADWFNLTGRMSSNRISDMPYTATPMNLDSDALYPMIIYILLIHYILLELEIHFMLKILKNSMQMMKKILIDLLHCSYHLLI